MRNVKELKAILDRLPDDALVVVMSDPEGNQTLWWDTVGLGKMTKGHWGWRETEDLDDENAVDVAFIWPGYGEKFDE